MFLEFLLVVLSSAFVVKMMLCLRCFKAFGLLIKSLYFIFIEIITFSILFIAILIIFGFLAYVALYATPTGGYASV